MAVLQNSGDFFLRVQTKEIKVLADRTAAEQRRDLRDDGYIGADRVQSQLRNIDAVNDDPSVFGFQ